MTGQENGKSGKLEYLAWACALVGFSPVLLWLWDGLVQSQQLRDALVVLVSILLVLAVDNKIRLRVPSFSMESMLWLAAAYMGLLGARFLGMWGALAVFVGLSAALVSFGLACLDRRNYAYAVGGSFFAFTILSLFINIFDLPLRILAGKSAAAVLGIFNRSAELLLFKGQSPQIGLMVDGRPYLVATECNGFGIISSCIILSIAFAILRRGISFWRRLAIVVCCALAGFAANAVRITAITLAAPHFGNSHYFLIHEALGYVFFGLALIAAWKISSKL